VLNLQLPLAIIPPVRFASDLRLMDRWRVSRPPLWIARTRTGMIVGLNGARIAGNSDGGSLSRFENNVGRLSPAGP
jgi:Mn2+/Fe2+ NRAMP family transporter